MVKLNEDSLDWAKEHLKKEGDTDLFPKPFEIAAIEANWDTVRDSLLKEDIGSYKWGVARRVIVPKRIHAFRVATQLDPIDMLVLAALIHEYGSQIEKMRIPVGRDVVFSHRFAPDRDGSLYEKTINWNNFWGKSLEKAEAIPDGWVAMADIADYYNQIYHHTLENQLQRAKLPPEVIKSILKLIWDLTQGVSRGIPVGPHVTHLLAEIAFDPIDRSLLSRGYKYCRFIDDIHIFCENKEKADIALFELMEILDKQQRLTLQNNKTFVKSTEEFADIAEKKLMDSPINEFEEKIINIIKKHSSGDLYRTIRFSELSETEIDLLGRENLESLFESYLIKQDPHFTRIRWLLRRLAQVGAPGAIPFLIKNIDKLTPALGDVGTYITSAEDTFEGDWKDVGKSLSRSLESPIINRSDYLQMTLINLFSRIRDLDHIVSLLRKYNSSSLIIKRKIIKAATKAGNDSWLRERKEEVGNTDPWLRRAIILGASTFPPDEKKFWLKQFIKSDNLLEKVVAKWVKSGGTL
jgi:hypothetical protein